MIDEPLLTPINDGRWRLVTNWYPHLRYQDKSYKFVVPSGFVSDLGTIPRVFRWIIDNDDFPAAFLLHDYLYRVKPRIDHIGCDVPRELADALMWKAMIITRSERKFKRLKAWLAWLAVRLFAYKAWVGCG
jgi:hypothetical protein